MTFRLVDGGINVGSPRIELISNRGFERRAIGGYRRTRRAKHDGHNYKKICDCTRNVSRSTKELL